MKKSIKYGLVAGLTMAAFSLGGAMPTFAEGGEADGAGEAASCTVTATSDYKYTFSETCELKSPLAAIAPKGTSDWDRDRLTLDGKTYALNVVGLTADAEYKIEIYANGDAFVPTFETTITAPEATFTQVSDSTYTYAYQNDSTYIAVFQKDGDADWYRDRTTIEKGANGSGTITFDLDGLEAGTYKAEFYFGQDLVVDYTKTFTIVDVVELSEVSVELEAAALYPGEETGIEVSYNEGYTGEPELSYTTTDRNVSIDFETGKVTVSGDYWYEEDKTVTLTITAKDGETTVSKTVTLTVKQDLKLADEDYEVTKGDKATFVAGSKEELSFTIDAPFDDFVEFDLVNKTLYEKFVAANYDPEALTEEEWNSFSFWSGMLEEGKDYTVKAGSTIITLSKEFMSKLLAGEYELTAYFINATDPVAVASQATATFTVGVAAPNTGAFTEETTSASVSNLGAAVLATVAAVVAAGATALKKLFRK